MAKRVKKYIGTLYEREGRRGYYLRFYIEGRRYKRFMAIKKADAEAAAEDLTSKILLGQIGGPNRVDRVRFEDFAETHLKQLEAEHEESTFRDEWYRFTSKITPAFSGQWVDEVTTADVERFLVEAARTPGTRNRFSSHLSRFFKRAIAHGHAKENPVAGVKRSKEAEHDVQVLSLAEQDFLLEAAHERIRDYVLLSIDTGCRQGELLRLEWRDVDLVEGTLSVRKAKGKRPRLLPLTARLRARLAQKKDARTIPLDGPDLVLPELDGKWGGHNVALFKRAVAAVGYPELRPHDLRHLCAVNLVRAGVPIPDVAEWLGHSRNSITVTMRYARHAPANAGTRARDLLDAARSRAPALNSLRSTS